MKTINGRKVMTFQIWRRMPIPESTRVNIPSWIKKKSDMIQKVPMSCIYLDIKTECSRKDIVRKIAEQCGFGTFNIMAWDKYAPNRKFSSTHRCPKVRCKFYQNGRCRRYRVYKTGQSCFRNPKFKPNWQVYGRVEILPSETDMGYTSQWFPECDRLHRLDWFMVD